MKKEHTIQLEDKKIITLVDDLFNVFKSWYPLLSTERSRRPGDGGRLLKDRRIYR